MVDKINPLKEGKEIFLQHCVDLWETTLRYFATTTGRRLQEELRYMGQVEFVGYFCHLVVLGVLGLLGFFLLLLVFGFGGFF